MFELFQSWGKFFVSFDISREVLPKRMNIGTLTNSDRFSKFYSFSICHLHTSGQQAPSCIG